MAFEEQPLRRVLEKAFAQQSLLQNPAAFEEDALSNHGTVVIDEAHFPSIDVEITSLFISLVAIWQLDELGFPRREIVRVALEEAVVHVGHCSGNRQQRLLVVLCHFRRLLSPVGPGISILDDADGIDPNIWDIELLGNDEDMEDLRKSPKTPSFESL